MPQPFEQTLVVLNDEQRRWRWLFAVVGLGFLLLWLVVMSALPLPAAVSSLSGSVVSAGAEVRLVAPTNTAIESVHVELGQIVVKGDVLVRFDAQPQRIELASKRAQEGRVQEALLALEAQAAILDPKLAKELESLANELKQAQSRRQQALSRIEYAQKAEALYAQLRSERRIDRLQYEEALANLAQERLELQSLDAQIARLDSRASLARSAVGGERESLRAQVAELARQAADLRGSIESLERDLAQTEVKAPTAAKVGALAEIGTGSVPGEDAWLLTLVPAQGSEFRAQFDAQVAGGRIQPGQSARIALHVLPWVEHGELPARVLRVASLPTEDRLEVVLGMDVEHPLHALVRQGYEGRANVDVESMTLLQRLLRLLSFTPDAA